MNIKNNKRRRESQTKIEKVFINMLLKKSINKISVTDICKETGLNRTTFYASYTDVYDLANKIRHSIENYFSQIFSDEQTRTALNFFKVIYDNQIMFKAYFKLAYETEFYNPKQPTSFYRGVDIKNLFKQEYIDYHITFFQAGLNAMIKKWLDNDCMQTPEEMAEIIKSEYAERNKYFSLSN